jgi:hypothetical protein
MRKGQQIEGIEVSAIACARWDGGRGRDAGEKEEVDLVSSLLHRRSSVITRPELSDEGSEQGREALGDVKSTLPSYFVNRALPIAQLPQLVLTSQHPIDTSCS